MAGDRLISREEAIQRYVLSATQFDAEVSAGRVRAAETLEDGVRLVLYHEADIQRLYRGNADFFRRQRVAKQEKGREIRKTAFWTSLFSILTPSASAPPPQPVAPPAQTASVPERGYEQLDPDRSRALDLELGAVGRWRLSDFEAASEVIGIDAAELKAQLESALGPVRAEAIAAGDPIEEKEFLEVFGVLSQSVPEDHFGRFQYWSALPSSRTTRIATREGPGSGPENAVPDRWYSLRSFDLGPMSRPTPNQVLEALRAAEAVQLA